MSAKAKAVAHGVVHLHGAPLVGDIIQIQLGVRLLQVDGGGQKGIVQAQDEPFFQGHFPQHPVMPGVLILEALAQTGAVAALSLPENRGKLALFGGIKNARFRRQVLPGDVLTLECELTEQHGPVGIGKATAWVDGARAVNAELMFVIADA